MFKKNFTKEDKEKWAENKEAEIKELEESLERGVSEIFGSDKYKEWLDVCSKFPSYSINNKLLIAMQTGGKATMVQSYGAWKKIGRTVKQGEKGIRIFAPAPYSVQKTRQTEEIGEDGEPVTEEVTIKRMSFKVVSVFDVSQTEGKEIPSIGVEELSGSVEEYGKFIEALKEVSTAPISFEEINNGAKGFYRKDDHRIVVKEGMSEVQTIKTLIHQRRRAESPDFYKSWEECLILRRISFLIYCSSPRYMI